MKYQYSIVVAINNRFSLVENFICHMESIVNKSSCDIVLVVDGPQEYGVHRIIEMREKDSLYTVVWLEKQYGYGKANNIGVKYTKSNNIIFIGTDVFPEPQSMDLLIDILIRNKRKAIVQGMTLYPQSGRIQSTGHIFGELINRHAFENRKPEDLQLPELIPRQALSSTFYAISKELFEVMGAFDEFYYNAWEGMELSLKASLLNYTCLCSRDAVAYHVRGGGRNEVFIDEEQQSAYFWSKWHDKIRNDHVEALNAQLDEADTKNNYVCIVTNQYRSWKETIINLKLKCDHVINIYPRTPGKYTFEVELPNAILSYPGSIIFACDNFENVYSNAYSITRRKGRSDIILDLSGNVIHL